MSKVVTIGGAMYDMFIEQRTAQTLEMHTDFGSQAFIILEEGHKIEIDNIIYASGGGGTNSAVSFQRLGHSTAAFFKTSNDHAGTFIRHELEQEGVDTRYSVNTSEMPTGTSFMIPCPSGNRAILVYRAANLTLTYDDLPLHHIHHYDVLYCTSLSHHTSLLLEPITKKAKDNNLCVAVNPGTSQLRAGASSLRASLPYIDILILNAHEAAYLFTSMVYATSPSKTSKLSSLSNNQQSIPKLLQTNNQNHTVPFNVLDFFEIIHQTGPSIIVVTNGAEGVYASAQDMIYFHPSIQVPIISSVGAGDAFGSTFVSCIVDNMPIKTALRAGICNAVSVIQHIGAKTGLLHKKELEHAISLMHEDLLQCYPKNK